MFTFCVKYAIIDPSGGDDHVWGAVTGTVASVEAAVSTLAAEVRRSALASYSESTETTLDYEVKGEDGKTVLRGTFCSTVVPKDVPEDYIDLMF